MDSGLYAAYTGLLARTQALDTAANNLANAGTVGFRAQRDYFRGVLAGIGDETPASQVGNAVNDFGILGGNMIDQGQGAMTATGNPLDMALNGQGFFAIQTKDGVQYTRDGAFTRSDTGVLQTAQGEPVLDGNGQPITIPTGTISVGADGTISVTYAGWECDCGQGWRVRVSCVDAAGGAGDESLCCSGWDAACECCEYCDSAGIAGRREYGCGAWDDAADPGAAAGRDDAEGAECLRYELR